MKSKGVHVISAVFSLAFCLGFLGVALREYYRGQATTTWPSTAAQFIRFSVQPSPRLGYRRTEEHSLYSYRVGGEKHRISSKRHYGSGTIVYYDPEDPADYSFAQGVQWGPIKFWVMLACAPGMLAAGFLILAYSRRAERFVQRLLLFKIGAEY